MSAGAPKKVKKKSGGKAARFTQDGAAKTQGVGSGYMPIKPPKMNVSHLKRNGRRDQFAEDCREHFRREMRRDGLEVDDAVVEAKANAWLISEFTRLAKKADFSPDDLARIPDLVAALSGSKDARNDLRDIADRLGFPHDWAVRAGDRDDVNAHVEARCVRESRFWKSVRDVLAANPGAPVSEYRLALGCLEAMMMEKGDFELRRQWKSFGEHNLIRGWGYDFPWREDRSIPAKKLKWRGDSALSEQGVAHSLFGSFNYLRVRGEKGKLVAARNEVGQRILDPQRPVAGGILNRTDPDVLIGVNLEAIAELCGTSRRLDCGIDGLKIRAPRLQIQSVSPEDELLINRYLECDMGNHNGVYWRGWMFLVLIDLATGLPLAWVLVNASRPEEEAFDLLMRTAYRHAPWLKITTVTTDSAFDNEPTIRCAEQVWGCHLLSARHGTIANKYPYAADDGAPSCCGQLMHQMSCDNFYDAIKREGGLRLETKVFPARAGKAHRGGKFTFNSAQQKITCDTGETFTVEKGYDRHGGEAWFVHAPPGVDIAPLVDRGLLLRAVIKWECANPDCNGRERTYPEWQKVEGRAVADEGRRYEGALETAWRVNTWAPRRPVGAPGREDRYAIRETLTAQHWAQVEGFNAQMRDRGVTMDGGSRARAVKSKDAMTWLLGLRALRQTLVRVTEKSGAYERARQEADTDDLLRAPTPEDLAAHRARKAERDDRASAA